MSLILHPSINRYKKSDDLKNVTMKLLTDFCVSLGGGGGGGTGDFEVSQHISKQIAIAQNLYTRGGQKYTFSESSLSALSRTFKMGSMGIPSKILASPLGKICSNGEVIT